jgi:hypothetical protein
MCRSVIQPKIEEMASGNLSLHITENVSWASFPSKADEFIGGFSGRVLRKFDTHVDRVWLVVIRWRLFFLSYDDYPIGMSLESINRFSNRVIWDLYNELSCENT